MEAWDSMMASTCNPSIQEIETGDQKLKFGAGELAGSGVKKHWLLLQKASVPNREQPSLTISSSRGSDILFH